MHDIEPSDLKLYREGGYSAHVCEGRRDNAALAGSVAVLAVSMVRDTHEDS